MASSLPQKKFQSPTAGQRMRALGETDSLKEDTRRALTIGIDDSFPSIPIPTEDDWLSNHPEQGQTVKQFQRSKSKFRPSPSRNKIYIQPIGDFDGPRSPDLNIICNFSHLFFPGCQTEILPTTEFDRQMKKRINKDTNQVQYLIPNLVAHLKKLQRKRRDHQELFSIGVTMVDIYPSAAWNFVYGEASIDEGIAIYSFARLDPSFPHPSLESIQRPCSKAERILILKRAVSTYLHEVMHLFDLEHCIYYLCLMNGTNCEEEMDGQLLYLCPICLRKMSLLFREDNYNVLKMYQGILELSKVIEWQEETQWYEKRLQLLSATS